MHKFVSRFFRDKKAATAIEYSLIAAGIAVAIAIGVFTLGSTVSNFFGNVLVAVLGG